MKTKTTLCALLASLLLATPAQGAGDPLHVFTPAPPPPNSGVGIKPPPAGRLEGPCGIAVDSAGRFYVSDYYHRAVDVFSSAVNTVEPWRSYVTQIAKEDPLDGPCGLSLDSSDRLYVNNYHRNVVRFEAQPAFGTGTVFPLPAEEAETHLPTGVAVDTATNRVYVDNRAYISVFDSAGNPVEEGGEPLLIGKGTLGDGYGLAVSQFPGTAGFLYVPDAATDTVEVYDPLLSKETPVATIKGPSGQSFSSLRDAAVAVDRVSGDVYVADDDQPEYTELPQATIDVFSAANAYKGHLKYNVIDALPPGLAVDNSLGGTQGRVYVTSGASSNASVLVYGPNSATTANPLPPIGSGLQAPGSAGGSSQGASGVLAQGAAVGSRTNPEAAQTSSPVVSQHDNLRVSVQSALSPKKLPRKGAAPISVSVGWDIATTDGSPPPKLKRLRIEINRNGRFDQEGLPTCPLAKIQPATTQRALSNCRPALVGSGSFTANIVLKGQEGESYPAQGKLLVFNGVVGGKPVLLGQIYSAHPFATSFVIVFKLSKLHRGDYGTALTAELPKALRSWGDLTGIQMSLSRRYSYEGRPHSFISAGCPAPKGFSLASFKLARTAFSFTGGTELSSTVVGECRARG